MRKYILCLCLFSCISCLNNYDESKDIPKSDKIVPVEIIKNKVSKTEKVIEEENLNLLTEEEKIVLSKEGIDLKKFSKLLSDANSGDKEKMIAVASIYRKLKLDKSFDDIVKLAIKYNVSEIIETKTIDYLKKSKLNEAEALLKHLKKTENNKILWADLYYKKAFLEFKKNEFKKAIKYFEISYNNGLKNSALQIAYSYVNLQDKEKKIEWFKKAYNDGEKAAGYELAVIYFNDKDYKKALPLLLEQYKQGSEKLILAIGICYAKLEKYDEATFWFEKAIKNGNKDAKKLLDEMNGNRKGSYNVEI